MISMAALCCEKALTLKTSQIPNLESNVDISAAGLLFAAKFM